MKVIIFFDWIDFEVFILIFEELEVVVEECFMIISGENDLNYEFGIYF